MMKWLLLVHYKIYWLSRNPNEKCVSDNEFQIKSLDVKCWGVQMTGNETTKLMFLHDYILLIDIVHIVLVAIM